jgi:hypothetical protein
MNDNIEWNQIPTNAIVVDLGSSFLVKQRGKADAVAFWSGNDAIKAQLWLTQRAKRDAKNPRAKIH